MQRRLHQWAAAEPGRRFDELYNLVYDPTFLVVAWDGPGADPTPGPTRPGSTRPRPARSVSRSAMVTRIDHLAQRVGKVRDQHDRIG